MAFSFRASGPVMASGSPLVALLLGTAAASVISGPVAAQSRTEQVAQASDQRGSGGSDSAISGRAALGIAIVPEYEGSSNFDVVPLAFARVDYEHYYLETRGLGVRVNLSPLDGIEAGPVIAYRGGRDDDVSSSRVAAMEEIDGAVEVGTFIRYDFGNVTGIQDNLAFDVEIRADVTEAHDGITITGGARYDFAFSERFRVGASVNLTYAGENYMQTYFGVSATDATASGFTQYDAEAGIKDVGISFTSNYALTQNWGIFGVVGYSRLLGDAADSPIVTEEGRPNQFFGGVALSYRF